MCIRADEESAHEGLLQEEGMRITPHCLAPLWRVPSWVGITITTVALVACSADGDDATAPSNSGSDPSSNGHEGAGAEPGAGGTDTPASNGLGAPSALCKESYECKSGQCYCTGSGQAVTCCGPDDPACQSDTKNNCTASAAKTKLVGACAPSPEGTFTSMALP